MKTQKSLLKMKITLLSEFRDGTFYYYTVQKSLFGPSKWCEIIVVLRVSWFWDEHFLRIKKNNKRKLK